MKVHGDYNGKGYAHIERLIAPEMADAFLRKMRIDLAAAGLSFQSFQQQGPLMRKPTIEIVGHAYSPMITFLWGLTPIMCELTGRDLLPSYDYFRFYQKDDICRVHSDRPACEHSLSLTLAYSDGQAWGLDIAKEPSEEAKPVQEGFGDEPYSSIDMAVGDAVLYRGVSHRHGRTRPNPNKWSAHLFLHWVDRQGPHADHAFDAVRLAQEAAHSGRKSGTER